MEERLWDYIDGNCTAEEKLFIEQLIATNNEWRAKYNELLAVHTLMSDHAELDEPSLRFTQNVMDEIGKHQIAPAAKAYINKNIIRGIGAFFLCSIVGLLVFLFSQLNWSLPENDKVPIDLSKLYNSTYVNIFMMVNVILGLVLLDMYLSRKKKALIEDK